MRRRTSSSLTGWLPWAALAVVVVGALLVGRSSGGEERSTEERVEAVASDFRCPTCSGQSVADSDAPAARAIREEIERRVGGGQDEDGIRAFLADRYPGSELNPPRSGAAGLVWALPVAGLVVVVAALAVAFRRWRSASPSGVEATAEDRSLVESARRRAP